MSENIFKVFGKQTKETLLEIIAKCMDDYLFVYDLQNDTIELSESAVDRFMISENVMNDVANDVLQVVYEEDRKMLQEHLTAIYEGKEKAHNLHYRWLDKEGMPVWVNCRGIVIDDSQGKPQYLVGCMNETGNQRRADNVTGLLGGLEFNAYMRSHMKHISKGFLMHIGIDDFGAINSSRGAAYGNYILKSVADCMKECLSDSQRIYHLVADQYVIVDLEHSAGEYAAELKKKIDDRLLSLQRRDENAYSLIERKGFLRMHLKKQKLTEKTDAQYFGLRQKDYDFTFSACMEFDAERENEQAGIVCSFSRSEEHTSELQSRFGISYDVFCLKKTSQ